MTSGGDRTHHSHFVFQTRRPTHGLVIVRLASTIALFGNHWLPPGMTSADHGEAPLRQANEPPERLRHGCRSKPYTRGWSTAQRSRRQPTTTSHLEAERRL